MRKLNALDCFASYPRSRNLLTALKRRRPSCSALPHLRSKIWAQSRERDMARKDVVSALRVTAQVANEEAGYGFASSPDALPRLHLLASVRGAQQYSVPRLVLPPLVQTQNGACVRLGPSVGLRAYASVNLWMAGSTCHRPLPPFPGGDRVHPAGRALRATGSATSICPCPERHGQSFHLSGSG